MILDQIVLRGAEDSAKTDLEVVCLICGEHLCDAEHDDSIGVLVAVAIAHGRDHHS